MKCQTHQTKRSKFGRVSIHFLSVIISREALTSVSLKQCTIHFFFNLKYFLKIMNCGSEKFKNKHLLRRKFFFWLGARAAADGSSTSFHAPIIYMVPQLVVVSFCALILIMLYYGRSFLRCAHLQQ